MTIVKNLIELTLNRSMAELASLKPLVINFYGEGAEHDETRFPSVAVKMLWDVFELKGV